jgi:hypothetical protein
MINTPTVISPSFKVNRKDLLEKVRLDNHPDLLKEFDQFVLKFALQLVPKAVYLPQKVTHVNNGTISLSHVSFNSPVLSQFLSTGQTVFPFISTCGTELENVDYTDLDYLAPYWIDAIKESALQAATDSLKDHVRTQNKYKYLSAMSPGSADANVWDIAEQQQLFSLFGDTQKLLGVSLTPSYLMVPNKTVSGILFQTSEAISDCRFCTRTSCEHRKEACQHSFLVSH